MCGESLVLFLYIKKKRRQRTGSFQRTRKAGGKENGNDFTDGVAGVGLSDAGEGADWFVDGASGIAERFGIPQLVVGLTIVAMGTSMPEAAVSINSALKGNAGITIGNIVGSNILNILIILGITAVITTVAVQKSTIWIEIPYMMVITVLLLVLGKSGNQITFSEGVILWVAFLLYLGYLFYCAKKNKEEVVAEEAKPMWKLLLATVLGLLLVSGEVMLPWMRQRQLQGCWESVSV